MDQDILRRLIEAKLADGRLPHDNIPRVWGGPSDGDTCNACDEVITKAHLVMEGISTEGGGVRLHVQCFYLWDTMRTVALRDAEFPHVAELTTVRQQLGASLVHDLNEPITAIVINGSRCLRWLCGDKPNLDAARIALHRLILDANRAADVMTGRTRLSESPGARMPAPMPSPGPALPEIHERRCPYCKSERIKPAAHIIASSGLIKVGHRCEACGTAFLFVGKSVD
jgi:hypothetical protein